MEKKSLSIPPGRPYITLCFFKYNIGIDVNTQKPTLIRELVQDNIAQYRRKPISTQFQIYIIQLYIFEHKQKGQSQQWIQDFPKGTTEANV